MRELLSEAASDNVLSPVHAHQYISSIPIWRLQPPWMQNGSMRKGRMGRALCFMEWDHWGTSGYRRAMRSTQEGEFLSTFYSKDSSIALWSEGIHSLIKVTGQLCQQRTIVIVAETRGPWLQFLSWSKTMERTGCSNRNKHEICFELSSQLSRGWGRKVFRIEREKRKKCIYSVSYYKIESACLIKLIQKFNFLNRITHYLENKMT